MCIIWRSYKKNRDTVGKTDSKIHTHTHTHTHTPHTLRKTWLYLYDYTLLLITHSQSVLKGFSSQRLVLHNNYYHQWFPSHENSLDIIVYEKGYIRTDCKVENLDSCVLMCSKFRKLRGGGDCKKCVQTIRKKKNPKEHEGEMSVGCFESGHHRDF